MRHVLASFALLCASVSALAQVQPAPGTSIQRLDPAINELIAPDAHFELMASGFRFTEGPMWRGGQLWFEDEEDDKTHAVTPEGQVSTLVDYKQAAYAFNGGAKLGPNGLAPAPDGSVVMCEQYKRAVERLVGEPGHIQLVPFLTTWEGHHLNSPNDLVFAKDGSFYFTDPSYGLTHGMDKDPAKEMPFNGVFHYKDGKLTAVIKDLTLPNGIALSPDEKTLYVNNSGPAQRTVAYPVNPDGTVGAPHDLMDFTGKEGWGIPDGMKVDVRGNVWTTGPGGIRIITPEGKVLGMLKFPVVARNLAWGEDGKTVYITGGGSVYRLRTLLGGNLPHFSR